MLLITNYDCRGQMDYSLVNLVTSVKAECQAVYMDFLTFLLPTVSFDLIEYPRCLHSVQVTAPG